MKELDTLRQLVGDYLPSSDIDIINQAYELANVAHDGQQRKTGEPYITHPIATAIVLARFTLDAPTIAAALLHDVPEDTPITINEIKTRFGEEIASLVDGVTKLSQVRLKKTWQDDYGDDNQSSESFETFDRHVETLRKMFLAMSHDLRVILIKLADRLHNASTLEGLPKEKQQRIALETLQVYAPLANRLGIGQIKGKLEDLTFPYAMPEEAKRVKQMVKDEFAARQKYIEKVRRVILTELAGDGIRAEAHGRAKHIYSLYKKLKRNDLGIRN